MNLTRSGLVQIRDIWQAAIWDIADFFMTSNVVAKFVVKIMHELLV
jgi:hypothetical protein